MTNKIDHEQLSDNIEKIRSEKTAEAEAVVTKLIASPAAVCEKKESAGAMLSVDGETIADLSAPKAETLSSSFNSVNPFWEKLKEISSGKSSQEIEVKFKEASSSEDLIKASCFLKNKDDGGKCSDLEINLTARDWSYKEYSKDAKSGEDFWIHQPENFKFKRLMRLMKMFTELDDWEEKINLTESKLHEGISDENRKLMEIELLDFKFAKEKLMKGIIEYDKIFELLESKK